MDIVILAVGIVNIALLIFLIVKKSSASGEPPDDTKLKHFIEQQNESIRRENRETQSELRREINTTLNENIRSLSDQLQNIQIKLAREQLRQTNTLFESQKEQLTTIGTSQKEILSAASKALSRTMTDMDKKMQDQLGAIGSSQKEILSATGRALSRTLTDMDKKMQDQLGAIGSSQKEILSATGQALSRTMTDMDKKIQDQLKQLETRFATLESNIEMKLQGIRTTVENQLKDIREDNTKQLEQIRGTVDEKLQKTLESKMNESFRLVSERLEQVYKGLGEMQTVAQGVGDLKKVLSNVKTRGILGEIQLGAILKEILTPDQYEENIATVPRSKNRVEFAVKLPGAEDGKYVYLPIDSKFNGDRFAHLQDAYESGDSALIAAAKKELYEAIRKCAKDISEKYLSPPDTTQFAVMFLPFEGLYAEVVNTAGLVEDLQRTYKVNIAGPSTMAAMLNSLKMGFQTLAIQKRSSEVWAILGAVKTEFETFEKALNDTQHRLRQTEESLEKLVGVRTRQMNRKLSSIDKLDPQTSAHLLTE